jgi:hypothetical protein
MIQIKAQQFVDEHDRSLFFRGISVGGNALLPHTPRVRSEIPDNFYDRKRVSYLDTPFPLEEADQHFKRLSQWGFNLVRLLVPWEAIEPIAPEQYDEAYLDHIRSLAGKAIQHGLWVLICPYQEAWSRFSGGAGAPAWTFELAGLDVQQFAKAGAATLHHESPNDYQQAYTLSNYPKLAAATMFTLFFAGNDFAPQTLVHNQIPIQEYLQQRYIAAYSALAQRLVTCANVIGYEVMHNPSAGWIGWENLHSNQFLLRKGPSPTPFQSMMLGLGNPCEVENWEFGRFGPAQKGKVQLNPTGVKAWLNGFRCIWKTHGVWESDGIGTSRLLKPHYFTEINERRVNFAEDYLLPFINRFAEGIRQQHSEALIFSAPPLDEEHPQFNSEDAQQIVNSVVWREAMPHFAGMHSAWLDYDLRRHRTVWGKQKIERTKEEHLQALKQQSIDLLGGVPTFISQVGIPFNLNDGRALKTQNYQTHTKATDQILSRLEKNLLLHYCYWNYTPTNTHEQGDGLNTEDCSIFSRTEYQDDEDPYSGGRSLKAILRPYPMAVSGIANRLFFDYRKHIFEFEFTHYPEMGNGCTELFIPRYQFPQGYKVEVSDGYFEMDEANQCLRYYHSRDREQHLIRISKVS